MSGETDFSKYIEKRHDELFGEGSWVELEKGVHERHPHLKYLLAQCDAEIEAVNPLEQKNVQKKWWEFWK